MNSTRFRVSYGVLFHSCQPHHIRIDLAIPAASIVCSATLFFCCCFDSAQIHVFHQFVQFEWGESANCTIYRYDNRFYCFDISCYDRLFYGQMHLCGIELRSHFWNLCVCHWSSEYCSAAIPSWLSMLMRGSETLRARIQIDLT